MAYYRYPEAYGATYYEADQEVVRGPYDSYSSEYRVQEYANPGYSMGPPHHHNGGYTDRVTEVVSYESNPGHLGHRHHHRRHGGVAEVVEKREEIIYENSYDPYRRGISVKINDCPDFMFHRVNPYCKEEQEAYSSMHTDDNSNNLASPSNIQMMTVKLG
ncbi:hypothetical protein Cgig2_031511 [Carnegiea gigantea]|uniref:Uncharacterized protein n=1 Tax=Carnegiea gigantea TaxID=171969 RepID=A0A9Q1K527_9CARY|nr:hypothetical protein Cgig2_031511 [Carnegiea gigantea]